MILNFSSNRYLFIGCVELFLLDFVLLLKQQNLYCDRKVCRENGRNSKQKILKEWKVRVDLMYVKRVLCYQGGVGGVGESRGWMVKEERRGLRWNLTCPYDAMLAVSNYDAN